MALPRDYAGQTCSLSRALEIVGERWSLLILRDAFLGVRRFGDFAAHLGLPRAVLADRLKSLTESGVLAGANDGARGYVLTEKGILLWPAVAALTTWGEEFYAPAGRRSILTHDADGGLIDQAGRCADCHHLVDVRDTVLRPGPGLEAPGPDADSVSIALMAPHRLLQPILG
jgi:DNA-binding HxlR family transcriptional regulator